MRSGHLRPRRCPLIYHQKSGQKRGGFDGNYSENMLQLFPAPALPPYIPPEKRSKWRRQPHIFLKNLPSLTETFLDDFRTGPAEIFKILFSLPSRSRPLCTGGEKLPFMYQDIFSLFPNGEVENFLILRYVAGGMPPGRKRGRHCEKYRPCFGAFCKRKLSGFSHHHFLLFLSKTVLTGTHFRYHPYLSL